MKIILNTKNYTNSEYSPYLEKGVQVKAPTNPTYVVGQLVVVKSERKKGYYEIGVILGCIDEKFDREVRIDLCGMTSIDKFRPAVVTDFGKSNFIYRDALYKECQGHNVFFNWETLKFTIEEPLNF